MISIMKDNKKVFLFLILTFLSATLVFLTFSWRQMVMPGSLICIGSIYVYTYDSYHPRTGRFFYKECN